MELFLLLSIGLSIVAFISIALNQAPPFPSVNHHKPSEDEAERYTFVHSGFEPAFPLDSVLSTPEKMNVLSLKDQAVLQDFKPLNTPEVLANLPEPAFQEELLQASTE